MNLTPIQDTWKLTDDGKDIWPLLYTNPIKGTCCEVRLNLKDNLIKRKFSINSITVNGKQSTQHGDLTEERIKNFFLNEVKYLEYLKDTPWIPKTVDYDIDEQWIIQEFYGPDLLSYQWQDMKPFLKEQTIDMYKFFKSVNMIKCNGSLSNMTLNTKNKQLIAIDFKWADKIIWKEESTKANKISLMLEMRSYWKWLSKIDRELPTILLEILDDPIP
jgi:hypothetical protein